MNFNCIIHFLFYILNVTVLIGVLSQSTYAFKARPNFIVANTKDNNYYVKIIENKIIWEPLQLLDMYMDSQIF